MATKNRRLKFELPMLVVLCFAGLIFFAAEYRQSQLAVVKMQTDFAKYLRRMDKQTLSQSTTNRPLQVTGRNNMSERRAKETSVHTAKPHCHEPSTLLLGRLDVDISGNDTRPAEIIPALKSIKFGGIWRPKLCEPGVKVAFIVPLRNRARQLDQFLRHMVPVFQRQLLEFRIFVVEQIGTTAFNKGAIYNLGFNTTFRYDDYDCYIFHDVDLLAEDDRNYYGCPSSPLHMSVAIDKFKYKLPYSNIFGGIQAFKKQHYITVNGFSNQYWGWGAEDDDMFRRVKKAGLKLTRAPADKGRYKMNQGQHYRSPGRKIWEARNKGLLFYHPLNLKQDGLSTISSLSYQMNIREMKLCTHISIDLSFTGGGE